MNFLRHTLAIALILGLGNAGHCDEFLGPLPVRDARPYNLLFLQFLPEGATVLPSGATKMEAQVDIINNLLRPTDRGAVRVIEDNEMQRLRLSYRRGLGHRWEVSGQGALLSRNGGLLDGTISAYHRLLGFSGSGRDNPRGRDFYPQGQSILFFQNARGVQANAGDATGIGDLSFGLKRALTAPQSRVQLALRAGLKIPTGSARKLLGSGGTDVGLNIDVDVPLSRRVMFYGSIGAVAMGRATQVPTARRSMTQVAGGIEWRTGGRDSLLLQLDSNSRAVTTGNRFVDGAQTSASVGYRHARKNGSAWALSISENGDLNNYRAPVLGNIGPDYTLSFGYQWRR